MGDRITAVFARNPLTGARTRYRATLFADCTGDGWIGYFAGAERMYGREAKSEYDEWPAPESRDELTMSGCIMDNGAVGYRYALRSEPKPYTVPEWARVLPEGFTRRIHRLNSEWWVEHGGRFDDLADPERARDELVRIEFAYWGWIKNESPMREKAANAELVSMAYMNARREGFRLTGDYILTANDALQGRLFPDRISYGGWPLDTHDPLGMENPTGNGYWKHHPNVPPYSIPYRCLYSKNIANLLVAGRCQSVTHIALGSVRVQATLFTLGQAAGTAAALMLQKGLLPREYGQRHIAELQQRLLKDDQYIPSLRNGDPLDFARKARVISTSAQRVRTIDRNDRGLCTADMPPHALDGHRRATSFARGLLERLDAVELPLLSESQTPVTLTAKLYLADTAASIEEGWKPVALLKGTVPPASDGFVRFVPERPVPLTGAYVWIELPKAKGIAWRLRAEPTGEGHFRAYCADRVWTPVYGQQYAFVTEPALRLPVETHPEAVIDGVSRPENGEYHGWRSDPALPLPQAIRLDFPEAVTASEVRLTFDTNLSFWETINRPPRLVKRYRVEALTAGSWTTLVEERDNRLRHRIHTFPKREMTALRVTVLETYGDPSARIFEIRVYDN